MTKESGKSTRRGMSFVRGFCVFSAMLISVVSLVYASQIEAQAATSGYSITEEEIDAARLKSAGVADEIMTADDFLDDGEKSADYEDIHGYINELSKNGIEAKSSDILNMNGVDGIIAPVNSEESESTDKEVTEEDNTNKETKEASVTDGTVSEKEADADDWRLILVNKQNPVPDDYNAELSNINSSLMADSRIIDDIYDMLEAANRDGVDLMICSAYRSYDRQTTLFNNKMNKLMAKGMNYMDAYQLGSMSVTVPGTSEHQLGLALDILTGSYTAMDDGFGETKAGIWLRDNAADYGFILRYPQGKEEITGIIYEPWHFRYVSKDYSKEITNLGVCLEEYLEGDY